jgi:hypothetical protein
MQWRGVKGCMGWRGGVAAFRFGIWDRYCRRGGKIGMGGLWTVEDSQIRHIYTVASSLDLVLRISHERQKPIQIGKEGNASY